MKTIVKVTVELEIKHNRIIPGNELIHIATGDIHHSGLAGASMDYGSFRVSEIKRWAQIKPKVKNEKT